IGAVADDGGVVTLSGNSITTQGDVGLGLYSITELVGAAFPANLTATDVTVETSGARSYGATAQSRNDLPVEKATLTITDSSVTTHGQDAMGLRAVLADYGTRPIAGRGEAALTANNTTVLTEGVGAYGAFARDNPASVTMNNTTVRTTGANAHGAVALNGGL